MKKHFFMKTIIKRQLLNDMYLLRVKTKQVFEKIQLLLHVDNPINMGNSYN